METENEDENYEFKWPQSYFSYENIHYNTLPKLSCFLGMKYLHIENCIYIEYIPQLPPQLKRFICASNLYLKRISNLNHNLEYFCCEINPNLKKIPTIHPKLQSLKLCSLNIKHIPKLHEGLKCLKIINCLHLKSPNTFPSTLKTVLLPDVWIHNSICNQSCKSIERNNSQFQAFNNIKHLTLSGINYSKYTIHNNEVLYVKLPKLKQIILKQVRLEQFTFFDEILFQNNQIKKICLFNCVGLSSIPYLPPFLNYLRINNCNDLYYLPPVLPATLKHFILEIPSSLHEYIQLPKLNEGLKVFYISNVRFPNDTFELPDSLTHVDILYSSVHWSIETGYDINVVIKNIPKNIRQMNVNGLKYVLIPSWVYSRMYDTESDAIKNSNSISMNLCYTHLMTTLYNLFPYNIVSKAIYKIQFLWHVFRLRKQFLQWYWKSYERLCAHKYHPTNLLQIINNCRNDNEMQSKLDTW